jgi:hypothetical protein
MQPRGWRGAWWLCCGRSCRLIPATSRPARAVWSRLSVGPVFRRRGTAHGLSSGLGAVPALGGARSDQVALNIGQAAEYRQHQPRGAGTGVGPRLRERSKMRLGVDDALDYAEQIEGAASEAINARHRHHVAGGQLAEHPVKLARSARAPVTFSR